MQIHRLPAYNFNTAMPIASDSLRIQITKAITRFSEFIKAKFEELHQLFKTMFALNRKPNATLIAPKLKGALATLNPGKVVTVLPNNSPPISPTPVNAPGPLPQTKQPHNIEKESQVSLWALAPVGVVFTTLATICYFLKSQSPTTSIINNAQSHSQFVPRANNLLTPFNLNVSFPCSPPLLCAAAKTFEKTPVTSIFNNAQSHLQLVPRVNDLLITPCNLNTSFPSPLRHYVLQPKPLKTL